MIKKKTFSHFKCLELGRHGLHTRKQWIMLMVYPWFSQTQPSVWENISETTLANEHYRRQYQDTEWVNWTITKLLQSYAYWNVHHLDIWKKGRPTRWHLLYYILLNMFQTLIRPSPGASEYLLCCVGWLEACWCYVAGLSVGDVVFECRLKPTLGYHITNSQSRYITPTHLKSAYTTQQVVASSWRWTY